MINNNTISIIGVIAEGISRLDSDHLPSTRKIHNVLLSSRRGEYFTALSLQSTSNRVTQEYTP